MDEKPPKKIHVLWLLNVLCKNFSKVRVENYLNSGSLVTRKRYLISQACCCCPLVKQCPVKQSREIVFFKKTIFQFAYHIMNRLQENIRRNEVKNSLEKKQVCFLFVLWLKFSKNSAQTCTESGILPWNKCFLRRDIYPSSLLNQYIVW